MPARWPISDTDVSQLPRCPTASFSVSCADAVSIPNTVSAASAATKTFIGISPSIVSSGDAFARRFAAAAERTPVHALRHDAFVGTDCRMRNSRGGRPNGWTAVLYGARRLEHQPPERCHRHVARAEALGRTIADRPHALPHRDVLVRDAGDAGEIPGLHGGAILLVIVRARADAVEVRVHVDAPFQHVELAPRV